MALSQKRQKKIAVVNDFSGYGRCSITVALPIISALKVQCCPVPTAVFSNHTGFSSFHMNDYTKYMVPYYQEWEKLGLEFDAIATGFLGSSEQIEIVSDFIERFKRENTIVLIDPVMGDYGKLYPTYDCKLAGRMVELLRYADILMPNLTEACILTGEDYERNHDNFSFENMCAQLCEKGPEQIVISGIEKNGKFGNYMYKKGKGGKLIESCKIGESRSGTGDIFSAIIAADAVNGVDFEHSIKHAADFIVKTIKKTMEYELTAEEGICFEEYLDEIGGF
ncbi:MAG: pyridoxamine kinase [Eubacteriales bacterium]